MEARVNYQKEAPGVLNGMIDLEKYISSTGLDKNLLNLVKMRASQINNCAWCLNMHSKDAKELGEKDERLCSVSVWKEAPFYTEKEKAALAWTEAVTLISKDGVSDSLFEEVHKYFNDKEISDLTLAIIAINGWNRLNVAFKIPIKE